MYCPECKQEWKEDLSVCPVCGFEKVKEPTGEWKQIGFITDKISADHAVDVLQAYEIKAVVMSKSGFFGQIGLPLNPFYSTGSAQFQISVPENDAKEAVEILNVTLGNNWQHEEEN